MRRLPGGLLIGRRGEGVRQIEVAPANEMICPVLDVAPASEQRPYLIRSHRRGGCERGSGMATATLYDARTGAGLARQIGLHVGGLESNFLATQEHRRVPSGRLVKLENDRALAVELRLRLEAMHGHARPRRQRVGWRLHERLGENHGERSVAVASRHICRIHSVRRNNGRVGVH